LKPVREDYLIIYADKSGECAEPFLSSSRETVQAWINDHFEASQEFTVRRISLEDFARDVTDEFQPPFDEDALPYAQASRVERAEHEYRMSKEAM